MANSAHLAVLAWVWGGLFLHAPLQGMAQLDGTAISTEPKLNEIQVT
jgi:hypothetical protein